MKRLFPAAILAMAASAPAWAQSSTITGSGVGFSRSASTAQAVSGQGGTAKIVSNSSVPADQTVRNVPSVGAPGLAAAGLETCLGSVSGGGAVGGTGFTFGTTIPDPGCAARLDARTLWSMGLKKAAVARLCLNSDVFHAMPEVCQKYLPPPAPADRAPSLFPIRFAQTANAVEPPRTIADIWLVEKANGKERLCSDYDVTRQSCRVWAHTAHPAPTKKAAPVGVTSQMAASPAPAQAATETETREKSL